MHVLVLMAASNHSLWLVMKLLMQITIVTGQVKLAIADLVVQTVAVHCCTHVWSAGLTLCYPQTR